MNRDRRSPHAGSSAHRPRLEELISLREAASRVGRHVSTLHRWADASRDVQLRTFAVGATLHTTEADLLEFFEESAKARRGGRRSRRPRPQLDRVERELDEMGI